MDALKAKSGYFQYEVCRDIDVWDFVRPDPACLYCFIVFSINLPDLQETWNTLNEESDPWLRICCLLLTGADEVSELKCPVSSLQANYWYNVHFEFFRRQNPKPISPSIAKARTNILTMLLGST